MAGESTTTTLSDAIPTIVSRMMIQEARDRTVIIPLVRNESLIGRPGVQMNFPGWPNLSAGDLTEGTDASPVSINTTGQSITADEAGIAFEVSDLGADSDILSGLQPFADFGGRALAEKIDNDLGTLFNALNGGTHIGAQTINMTELNFVEAISALEVNRAPRPFNAVLAHRQWADVRESLAGTQSVLFGGGTVQQEELLRTGFQSRPFGVGVFTTSQLQTNTSSWIGAMFSEEAMGILWKWRARTEIERNALGRSSYIVVTAAYGVGELVDAYGVPIETDA